jgi:hypothetical protein
MKSPWHLGLLTMAVIGVSTYDYMYFMGGRSKTQPPAPVSASLPASRTIEPVLAPLSEPIGSTDTNITTGSASIPPISREDLDRLAQKTFVPKEFQESTSENGWPKRDPFTSDQVAELAPQPVPIFHDIPMPTVPAPVQAQAAIPEPQCVFSGTLIESEQRLALVNGMPISVGDRLGIWQLTRIEPDYLILEAGKETRRIELKGSESQISRRKDPS